MRLSTFCGLPRDQEQSIYVNYFIIYRFETQYAALSQKQFGKLKRTKLVPFFSQTISGLFENIFTSPPFGSYFRELMEIFLVPQLSNNLELIKRIEGNVSCPWFQAKYGKSSKGIIDKIFSKVIFAAVEEYRLVMRNLNSLSKFLRCLWMKTTTQIIQALHKRSVYWNRRSLGSHFVDE